MAFQHSLKHEHSEQRVMTIIDQVPKLDMLIFPTLNSATIYIV